MELVKLEIKLLEPALFTARRLGSTYLLSENYIKAGALKGAIVNEAFRKDSAIGKKALEELSVSSAYPSGSLPAHAYILLFKRKSQVFYEKKGILSADDLFEKKFYSETLRWLKELKEDLKPEPKSVIGSIVKFSESFEGYSTYKKVTAEAVVVPNVAVSKRSGSSQRGMLFFYETVKTGSYWALVDYSKWKELGLEDELTVTLGKSRIGGEARISLVQKNVEYAEKGNAYCLTECLPSFGSAPVFDYERALSAASVYRGWFTNDDFSSTKPVFSVMKEGSILKLKSSSGAEKLMPAGLNFMLSAEDGYSMLKSIGEVS